MIRKTRASAVLALGTVAALSLSACGGGSTSGTASGDGATAEKGGTLYFLTKRPTEHLDPQRVYIGRDIANLSRTVYRGLLQNPANEKDGVKSQTPIPDIATEVPTSEDGKTWTFELKSGVKWEDGKEVTCEDFKYGASRNFAASVLDGGPNFYVTQMLDIPTKGGESAYAGPYKKTGQELFDKAVTCDGNKLTYRFKQAWADFPKAVASLHAFAPFREDKDQGAKNNLVIFSNGPYKLEGTWDKDQGGTLVRNDQYDPATDEGTRAANPDKIVFTQGLEEEIIAKRLVADAGDDAYAITDRNVPPSAHAQAQSVADRTTTVESPYTDYLLPSFVNMKDQKVREALMWATNKEAYVNAQGGEKAGVVANTLVSSDLEGWKDNEIFKAVPPTGDPAKAKALLEEAGVKTPYPIKVTYPGTPARDNALAGLKDGWEKAGFKVTLNSLPDTYYDVVNKPNGTKSDVLWGGWGADYPSIATVLPPLFDSRQMDSSQVGNNYGQFADEKIDAGFDAASKIADPLKSGEAYMEQDTALAEQVAYIPLDVQTFYLLRGSKVTGYTQTGATSMYPDLGTIGVAK